MYHNAPISILRKEVFMKKTLIASAIALCLVLAAGAQAKNGPIVDKVIFDVRMDQAIAIKDTVEGKTDVFYYGIDGKTFATISAADKAKLDVYAIPSGSWSLLLNPIPNKAPYSFVAKDGKTVFNPLAILLGRNGKFVFCAIAMKQTGFQANHQRQHMVALKLLIKQ